MPSYYEAVGEEPTYELDEERVSNYQRYLDKQQYKQQVKFLFVVALPFILFVLMVLVGD